MTSEFTRYVDVAQVSLYVFWAFFAGLIFYLHREDKREGYPLVREDGQTLSRGTIEGFGSIPSPKMFRKPDGGVSFAPRIEPVAGPIAALPAGPWPGAPLIPTGNPLVDGVGPASWVARSDEPDLTLSGDPRLVPLRRVPEYYVSPHTPNPQGWAVVGADGLVAGIVHDLWVDEVEKSLRYLEVELDASVAIGRHHVLVPEGFAKFRGRHRRINVRSILAAQFADIPVPKHPDQITLREEDRLLGYFGGGALYATPSRVGPLL